LNVKYCDSLSSGETISSFVSKHYKALFVLFDTFAASKYKTTDEDGVPIDRLLLIKDKFAIKEIDGEVKYDGFNCGIYVLRRMYIYSRMTINAIMDNEEVVVGNNSAECTTLLMIQYDLSKLPPTRVFRIFILQSILKASKGLDSNINYDLAMKGKYLIEQSDVSLPKETKLSNEVQYVGTQIRNITYSKKVPVATSYNADGNFSIENEATHTLQMKGSTAALFVNEKSENFARKEQSRKENYSNAEKSISAVADKENDNSHYAMNVVSNERSHVSSIESKQDQEQDKENEFTDQDCNDTVASRKIDQLLNDEEPALTMKH
jgi:hypothetical protein